MVVNSRLSVGRVLHSRVFSMPITIVRQSTAVGSDGVVVTTPTTIVVRGVITAGSASDFNLVPEAAGATNSISVFTRTQLDGPSVGRAADIIVHQGNRYRVMKSYDWSLWGAGWFGADCVMEDLEVSNA